MSTVDVFVLFSSVISLCRDLYIEGVRNFTAKNLVFSIKIDIFIIRIFTETKRYFGIHLCALLFEVYS